MPKEVTKWFAKILHSIESYMCTLPVIKWGRILGIFYVPSKLLQYIDDA